MQTLGVGEEVMLGELVYLMYSVDTFQKLRLQHQRLWDGNGWERRGGPRSLPSVTTRKAQLLWLINRCRCLLGLGNSDWPDRTGWLAV